MTMTKTVQYKFYYSYKEEVYGVMKGSEEGYLVKLLRTGETEIIKKSWLKKQIDEDNIDISFDGFSLEDFKEEFLYEKT